MIVKVIILHFKSNCTLVNLNLKVMDRTMDSDSFTYSALVPVVKQYDLTCNFDIFSHEILRVLCFTHFPTYIQ